MQTGCNRAADRRRCRSADRARRLAAALLLLSAAVACGREEPPAGPLQARNLLNGPFETAPETPSDAQNPEAHADAPLALRTGEPTRFSLELSGRASLAFAGKASGEGELAVRMVARSPETGRALEDRTVRLRPGAGRLESELDLAPFAAGVVSVELLWKGAGEAALTLERLELREEARERVPIILFSIDTLSARHTSLHGYARRTTPRLEELAAESVVFEECLANGAFTSPSYASQFTGLLPRSTWVDPEEFQRETKRPAKKYETWHVPSERWTIAESLRASGYRTAAFVDNPMASPAFGFEQGFELYDMSAQAVPLSDPDGGIRMIVPMALDWLDRLPEGEPFFLFVNVLDVHGPYGPPSEFLGHFADEGEDSGEELPVCPDGHEIFGAIPSYNAYTLSKKPVDSLPIDPMVRLYDEEILSVDAELSKFVEALRKRGLLERCALVITSDHGETMAQGDFKFGHGVHVQENLQVPLVVRLPGGRLGGTRVAQRVQLLDLYPTFQELAGLPARAYLHGRSLLALAHGVPQPERSIWHEGGLLESTAVTEGKWRLVEWHPGTGVSRTRYSFPPMKRLLEERAPELYDALWNRGTYAAFLEAIHTQRKELREIDEEVSGLTWRQLFDVSVDPHQMTDVALQHPEIVERLGRLLDEGHERSRQARQYIESRATELDPELESQLRDLGYVGGAQE